ncbi:hypothetical protein LEP1GSC042_0089 [Leptospira kirschneri serovar Bim str. PUO 1247]|nr:hypothetical protein LEP1GSC042_0089 [Leptospira kirschneri serovar Bim str. PUO 1247]
MLYFPRRIFSIPIWIFLQIGSISISFFNYHSYSYSYSFKLSNL